MKTIDEILHHFDGLDTTPDCDRSFIKKLLSSIYYMNQVEANDLYDSFEGSLLYNKYMTEKEFINNNMKIVNYDGTKGGRIKDFTNFFKSVTNPIVDNKPCYNEWALKFMINIIISDYGQTLQELVSNDMVKYNNAVYRMAIDKLKDMDNLMF